MEKMPGRGSNVRGAAEKSQSDWWRWWHNGCDPYRARWFHLGQPINNFISSAIFRTTEALLPIFPSWFAATIQFYLSLLKKENTSHSTVHSIVWKNPYRFCYLRTQNRIKRNQRRNDWGKSVEYIFSLLWTGYIDGNTFQRSNAVTIAILDSTIEKQGEFLSLSLNITFRFTQSTGQLALHAGPHILNLQKRLEITKGHLRRQHIKSHIPTIQGPNRMPLKFSGYWVAFVSEYDKSFSSVMFFP
jgi:hypothetical protein